MKYSHGQTYRYNSNEIEKEKFNTSEFIQQFSLSKLNSEFVTWVNFYTLDDFPSVEAFLKKQKFDTLVISNVREQDSRPQYEDYGDYLFFSVRAALPNNLASARIKHEQLSFILGKDYLISMQSRPSDYFLSVRDRLDNKKGIIRDHAADFLLYRLLDAVIDNYYNVLDSNSSAIELLDGQVTKTSNPQVLTNIELQKRKLMELRRIVLPLKEIVISLEASKSPLFQESTKHYFSDLRQNCFSIIEEIESNKIALDGLTNLYYAVQGQRMNEVMKVLTIVSTIFIPLTFIAGIYGMNFDNMPELEHRNGYFLTLGFMLLLTICLLTYFYRKGWLRKNN